MLAICDFYLQKEETNLYNRGYRILSLNPNLSTITINGSSILAHKFSAIGSNNIRNVFNNIRGVKDEEKRPSTLGVRLVN